jgi:hypothetical protein
VERRDFLQALGLGAVGAVAGAPQAHARARQSLANAHFSLAFDPSSGAVTSIVNPADRAQMNWTSAPDNAPWREKSLLWGLGYADLGKLNMHRGWWETPQSVAINSASGLMTATYAVADLHVAVTRQLSGDAFTETYVFSNAGPAPIPMSDKTGLGTAIVLPFNDHYTSAGDVRDHRAHTHIWAGGSSAWVATLRMGGRGPHLGLVVTQGALTTYSITGRDQITSSNTRGTFLFHPGVSELKPGESYTLAWTCFWHDGWDDFFAQAEKRSAQFVGVDAPHLTAFVGESLPITVRGQKAGNAAFDTPLPFSPTEPGEKVLQLHYGDGLTTKVVVNAVPSLHDIIHARAQFIATRQQVNATGDPLDGAYLVYDNQLETIVRKDWGSDRNEARERIGMGVLLARWLRQTKSADPVVTASLDRYYAFVSDKLQTPDGYVRDGLTSTRTRLYNWPWVAQLHLEMFRLTGSKDSLDRFATTIKSFYARGGAEFYAIGLPVAEGLAALKATNRLDDHAQLLELFSQHGSNIATNGTNYPTSEVNFEQSIVAPAAILLLELHRATGDMKWLDTGKAQLAILELFNGRQPDHHLREIAIRHWDEYWFGKRRMWGDTQPHYWSTLTALAFANYGRITGDTGYAARADTVIRNNLSLFTPDGRGSAAFLYPASVNGEAAHFYDAYANDQDWALVHALQIAEI